MNKPPKAIWAIPIYILNYQIFRRFSSHCAKQCKGTNRGAPSPPPSSYRRNVYFNVHNVRERGAIYIL